MVYGISDFGLSNNLGISRKEAKAYIDTYFERFPGIKNYMDEVVREARDKGYVETLFKRRRELPDINSRNFNISWFCGADSYQLSYSGFGGRYSQDCHDSAR